MDLPGSVTRHLDRCKAGDHGAARPLYDRYIGRLTALAERQLRSGPPLPCDGEDIALSAFAEFFGALARGQHPRLSSRDELWAVLVTIVRHKVLDWVKHARRGKRDARRTEEGGRLEQLEGRGPTPDLAVLLEEEGRRLLERLGDERLRRVALLKLDGCTDREVATEMGCGLRTVERKLELIRCIWAKECE
jgi:RNA polymerase sigma factor (sigma-70 family)